MLPGSAQLPFPTGRPATVARCTQDEPTSGLDARAASIVMRAVRNIVSSGRTVVCTIHQPSVEIFQVRCSAAPNAGAVRHDPYIVLLSCLPQSSTIRTDPQAFDELLLLKRCGETIYEGEIGRDAFHLTSYLLALPGVQPLPEGQNPANWMLDETAHDVEAQRNCDYAELFRESEKAK